MFDDWCLQVQDKVINQVTLVSLLLSENKKEKLSNDNSPVPFNFNFIESVHDIDLLDVRSYLFISHVGILPVPKNAISSWVQLFEITGRLI